ncbi:cardiolipin synthase [Peptoniphilus sp. KCTC 25270]|uniref:cardiolipin synthase n=1 Tax=Peptoniphilus sp. KCTC 25270 TaxID=2897414 RepID=UPI001E4F7281|nr:cardiolipin synthase [Peptoniphilus sp. KCTC 25270]MCD1147574.1 cardiolipin synthase [Peptoniphilus sp. KCTC 25270]
MKNRIQNNVTGTLTTVFIYLILFVAQFGLIFYVSTFLNEYYDVARYIFYILDAIVAVQILNDRGNDPTYKMAFLFTIIIFPFFGAILYVLGKRDIIRARFSQLLEKRKEDTQHRFIQDPKILEKMKETDPLSANTARFLWNEEKYPTYHNADMEYFTSGEEYFKALKRELEKAEKFIFMEYFILQQGKMWGEILDILKEKVEQGVEVRILYDGTAMLTKVPLNFPKELEKLGIKTFVFKPIIPVLSLYQNNRDHRKILVIDNRCAFTGGVNIADEYINEKELFGHWKDTGTLTYGCSTRSFTLMFLNMWNVNNKEKEDYEPYLLTKCDGFYEYKEDRFITPFGDDPYGENRVGKEVYNDIVNQGVDYVHIVTPYLIIDEETKGDLIHLAQSGVEVKIITPHIPDKKMVFLVTRSYYKPLLRGGVKIYEYTPGFIHAKSIVSDDKKAVVGTINLDYRSLFLHFECGSYFYDEVLAKEVEADFQDTLSKSHEFTYEMTKEFAYWERALGRLLRVFAPMM